ncbi:MAG: hypothetical protein ACKVRP_15085 [Bacteroidota bacterium]
MEETIKPAKWPLVSAIGFVVAYFVARGGLEMSELSTWMRVALALLPVVPFVFMLIGFARGIREMDELERRIQLEALAFAFPMAMLLILTLGLLELAIDLSPDDWSYRHVWAMLPMLYFGGLVLAKRRYQ